MDKRHLATLRRLLAEGSTLAEAARAVGSSRSTVHRIAAAAGFERRRRDLAPDKRALIDSLLAAGELSLTQIARRARVSKSTVSQIANAALNSDPALPFRPRHLRKPRLCRRCNRWVSLWPCVACAGRDCRTEGRKAG